MNSQNFPSSYWETQKVMLFPQHAGITDGAPWGLSWVLAVPGP